MLRNVSLRTPIVTVLAGALLLACDGQVVAPEFADSAMEGSDAALALADAADRVLPVLEDPELRARLLPTLRRTPGPGAGTPSAGELRSTLAMIEAALEADGDRVDAADLEVIRLALTLNLDVNVYPEDYR